MFGIKLIRSIVSEIASFLAKTLRTSLRGTKQSHLQSAVLYLVNKGISQFMTITATYRFFDILTDKHTR